MINNILHQDHNRQISERDFLLLNMDDVYIIDVRNSFELSSGFLKCAQNIPFSEVLTFPFYIPKDKIILTYCNYGNRAGKVALALFEAGYNAYSLGGYSLFSQKIKSKCNYQSNK
ncbi:MAG: rhodanese-like domain-containing protein [Spirochaetota bacterium]|nr:rhodanese-like domain-containing protein [Spirochaetota bacterium]